MQQGVLGRVCVSVKSHLTSGGSVLKLLSRTKRATEVKKFVGLSTACLKAIHTVGNFPAESTHAHYS